MLNSRYISWYEDIYKLAHEILHGSVNKVKAREVELWQDRIDEFVRRMAQIIDKIVSEKKWGIEGAIMKFRIVIEQDEDRMFVVKCTNFPSCISQGKTREEAMNNIKDAILGYLESLRKHNELVPS